MQKNTELFKIEFREVNIFAFLNFTLARRTTELKYKGSPLQKLVASGYRTSGNFEPWIFTLMLMDIHPDINGYSLCS